MTDDEIRALAAKAQTRFDALSPVDQAIEKLLQRRSFAIGLSDFDTPVENVERQLDAMPEYVLLKAYCELRVDNGRLTEALRESTLRLSGLLEKFESFR